MASSSVIIQRWDEAQLDTWALANRYPYFTVTIGSFSLMVDHNALETAEQIAAHMIEGVRVMRERLAKQPAGQRAAAATPAADLNSAEEVTC